MKDENEYISEIISNKKYDEAITYFENRIKINSNLEEKYIFSLIDCYTHTNTDIALNLLNGISKKYVDNAKLYALYGAVFLLKENYNEAKKYLLKALSFHKKDLNAYILPRLIFIEISLNNISSAVNYSEQFLDENSNENNKKQIFKIYDFFAPNIQLKFLNDFLNTKYNNDLFFIEKAALLNFAQGNLALFIEFAKKAIELKTQNPEIYYCYIVINLVGEDAIKNELTAEYMEIVQDNVLSKLKNSGLFFKSIINQAIELCPYDKDLWRISAEIYETIDDYSTSKSLYKEILEKENNDIQLINECKAALENK